MVNGMMKMISIIIVIKRLYKIRCGFPTADNILIITPLIPLTITEIDNILKIGIEALKVSLYKNEIIKGANNWITKNILKLINIMNDVTKEN